MTDFERATTALKTRDYVTIVGKTWEGEPTVESGYVVTVCQVMTGESGTERTGELSVTVGQGGLLYGGPAEVQVTVVTTPQEVLKAALLVSIANKPCDVCGRRQSWGCGHSGSQRAAARRHYATKKHKEGRCACR